MSVDGVEEENTAVGSVGRKIFLFIFFIYLFTYFFCLFFICWKKKRSKMFIGTKFSSTIPENIK